MKQIVFRLGQRVSVWVKVLEAGPVRSAHISSVARLRLLWFSRPFHGRQPERVWF